MLRRSAVGKPLKIEIVAAFLRLGKKYEIELLHADALERLHYELPSTLQAYDKRGIMGSMITVHSVERFLIEVANLLREQSVLLALPAALYMCCRRYQYNARDLIEGTHDGVSSTIQLSTDNLLACLGARTLLSTTQAETTLLWANSHEPTYSACKSPSRCATIRKDVLLRTFLPRPQFLGHYSWKRTQDLMPGKMCNICKAIAKPLHNAGRIEFWDALPGIFGLPKWEELMKE